MEVIPESLVSMHDGQLKLNLRCKRKELSGLKGLLLVVGLVVTVMVGGVRAGGTHLESWMERFVLTTVSYTNRRTLYFTSSL